jgi:hypothetical protein
LKKLPFAENSNHIITFFAILYIEIKGPRQPLLPEQFLNLPCPQHDPHSCSQSGDYAIFKTKGLLVTYYTQRCSNKFGVQGVCSFFLGNLLVLQDLPHVLEGNNPSWNG